jgi:predicted transcriptional regulator
MGASMRITAELDTDTKAIVDSLAASKGITGAEFAAEAIRRVAESEADYRAFIQVGIDAADRGDVVSHEVVMAELDQMIERHRSRCG